MEVFKIKYLSNKFEHLGDKGQPALSFLLGGPAAKKKKEGSIRPGSI